jgi:glycosyltransferase involved in cell wall biosynthesis
MGIPFVYEMHAEVWKAGFFSWLHFKNIILSPNLVGIVVISEALKAMLLQIAGSLGNRIHVAHDAAKIPEERFSESFNSSDCPPKVGYFGSIHPGRGIELIVKCAMKLPKVEFHIFGGQLSDLAKLKISKIPNNFFLHGFIDPSSTAEKRSQMTILLAPYQIDVETAGGVNTGCYMSPLKVFEYMSSRRAIISSDLPALREVLNPSNSMLVEPSNVGAWVAAITALLDDRHLQTVLANQAFDDFINNYTWPIRAKKLTQRFPILTTA